jgi:hypothetical protein
VLFSLHTEANRGFSLAVQARNAAPAVVNASSIQSRNYAAEAKATPTEVSSILEQRIRGVQEEAGLAETGRVLSVGYVEHPAASGTTAPDGHAMNTKRTAIGRTAMGLTD